MNLYICCLKKIKSLGDIVDEQLEGKIKKEDARGASSACDEGKTVALRVTGGVAARGAVHGKRTASVEYGVADRANALRDRNVNEVVTVVKGEPSHVVYAFWEYHGGDACPLKGALADRNDGITVQGVRNVK